LTWLLTALSVVGVILNILQDRRCFYVWTITNSCWAAVDFYRGLPAQGTMFLLYLGLSVSGLYRWKHKAKQASVCRACGESISENC
jgi:nicotinamide riboside transporter PnuC